MRCKQFSFLLALIFLFACQSDEERSVSYQSRMNIRLDSLCKSNALLCEHLLNDTNRLGDQAFIHTLHYRSMLSDFILEAQYDDVPPADSLHWVSELHLYHQYHQMTYGILQDIAAQPSDSLVDLLVKKENEISEQLQQMSALVVNSTFCSIGKHGIK